MTKGKKFKPGKAKPRHYSTIKQHKQTGKRLIPPLAQIPQLQLHSWRDDRLPDVLWAALITSLDRKEYLELFRAVGRVGSDLGEAFDGHVEHSALAKLPAEVFDKLLAPVLESATARTALKPLLLYDGLPDKSHWQRHLEAPDATGLSQVAAATGRNSFHQSEAATDLRWLRVLALMSAGRMKFPREMEERVHEIFEYPYRGDMREVRPSIRAAESTFSFPDMNGPPSDWPEVFWQENWDHSECIVAPRKRPEALEQEHILEELSQVYKDVARHFIANTPNTKPDPRRDAAFGLVFYGLNLALTLNSSAGHERAEGRIVVRTIVECLITLAFLLKKDDASLWEKYRQYGAGQAKLAYLKLVDLDADELPDYVKIEELEDLANEDVWQEFQDVELGNWAGADLRRMSEDAGLKAIYDKYYGWPSGYVHGQWGAVRDTTFDLCLNPLHRLHRVPAAPRLDMGSVGPDSIRLCNLLLDQLNFAYPTFKPRLPASVRQKKPGVKPASDSNSDAKAKSPDSSPPDKGSSDLR